MIDQSNWEYQEYKGSTDSSSICDESLRVSLENDYDYDWQIQEDASRSLNEFSIILEQEFAYTVVAFGEPSLDRKYLHEVIPERYGQNWHRWNVKHGVEVADLTHHWDVGKVLVVKTLDFAWVRGAVVGVATES